MTTGRGDARGMRNLTPAAVAAGGRAIAVWVTGKAIVGLARLVTGVHANWAGTRPDPCRRVYFANHSSHGDSVLIWTVLPPRLRARTRPVAAADYWLATRLRRFFGVEVFRAILIDRGRRDGHDRRGSAAEAIGQMAATLDAGDSLILFPEGTRNVGDEALLAFKSGLFRLATARPEVEMVPVWIDSISRVMPKGEVLPVPILCTVTFGTPLTLSPDETSEVFLERARLALLALRPGPVSRSKPRSKSRSKSGHGEDAS